MGDLKRFNPAFVALRPHVRNPVYFEIHRVGEFTARSLDIDVVLDLIIPGSRHRSMAGGRDVELTDLHAVGIPILTDKSTPPMRVWNSRPAQSRTLPLPGWARKNSGRRVFSNHTITSRSTIRRISFY